MVIYEVNLSIDADIYPQYHLWLKKHAKEMLEFPGFIQARILKPENEQSANKDELVVQYKLESREALNNYFTEFAPKMRQEGLNLFKDKFSAKRRVLEIEEDFSK